jgi:hypothetical protein
VGDKDIELPGDTSTLIGSLGAINQEKINDETLCCFYCRLMCNK